MMLVVTVLLEGRLCSTFHLMQKAPLTSCPIVLFYRSPWKLSQTKYGYCYTIGIRTVQIRHRNSLSEQIKVERGTRQGGLTRPLLFNMYYKDLIQELQECSHGVTIDSHHYNSFCCADDVLLCSTTVSGLQELINIATRYVN